jgi:hypothetical protein
MHSDDKWVKFYNEVMASSIPIPPEEPKAEVAQAAQFRATVDKWMAGPGMEYLQQVIYQKLTPHEGAVRFYRDLKALK